MKASRDGPSIVVIGAASGTGRAMALDVVASSADALSLADVDAAGPKRVSERLPGEIRVKALVEVPHDWSAAARTREAECAHSGGLLGLSMRPGSGRKRTLWMVDCITGTRSLRSMQEHPPLAFPLKLAMPTLATRRGSGEFGELNNLLRSGHDAERLEGGRGWDAKCRHLQFCRNGRLGDWGEPGRHRSSHCTRHSRCRRECRHHRGRDRACGGRPLAVRMCSAGCADHGRRSSGGAQKMNRRDGRLRRRHRAWGDD